MIIIELLVLFSDLAILWYVRKECLESRETNKALVQVFNKQRKQKKRISVDRIIKAATTETMANG